MLNKLTIKSRDGHEYVLDLSLVNNNYDFNKEKIVNGCVNKAVIFADRNYKEVIKSVLKLLFVDAINDLLSKCKVPSYPNPWILGLDTIEYELKFGSEIYRCVISDKLKIKVDYNSNRGKKAKDFWINSGIRDYSFKDEIQTETIFSFRNLKASFSGVFKKSILIYNNFELGLNHEIVHKTFQDLINDNEQQTLIFTDNVTILSNDYLRPDCYFKTFTEGNITKNYPLHILTYIELRSAHNIEKMFRAGAFNKN